MPHRDWRCLALGRYRNARKCGHCRYSRQACTARRRAGWQVMRGDGSRGWCRMCRGSFPGEPGGTSRGDSATPDGAASRARSGALDAGSSTLCVYPDMRTSSPAYRNPAFHVPLQSISGAAFSPSPRTLAIGLHRRKRPFPKNAKQFRKSRAHGLTRSPHWQIPDGGGARSASGATRLARLGLALPVMAGRSTPPITLSSAAAGVGSSRRSHCRGGDASRRRPGQADARSAR